MQNRRQFTLSVGAMAGLASLSPLAALAHQQLDIVRIINGFPAGGTADATSRRVAEKMTGSSYTRAAVVENRTGAAARIAVEAVRTAAPDGRTLLLTPYSMMVVYPHIYKTLSYDPFKDFVPVSLGAIITHGFAVGPMVPASVTNIRQFLDWAKANPRDANYGSPAAGSTPHFLAALLGINTGVALSHVPYRGSTPGVADLMGGTLAAMCTPHGDFIAGHQAGRLRVLATSGQTRSPFLPDVPTFIEQGFNDLMVEEWFGFYAPARTPAATVNAASEVIRQALADKSVIDGLATIGLIAKGSTPEEMDRSQRAEFERWGPIVKKIGFTAES